MHVEFGRALSPLAVLGTCAALSSINAGGFSLFLVVVVGKRERREVDASFLQSFACEERRDQLLSTPGMIVFVSASSARGRKDYSGDNVWEEVWEEGRKDGRDGAMECSDLCPAFFPQMSLKLEYQSIASQRTWWRHILVSTKQTSQSKREG